MENGDNIYATIDGYIDSAIGSIPNLTFMKGKELALKYGVLTSILFEYEDWLKKQNDEEHLEKLKNFKKSYENLKKW